MIKQRLWFPINNHVFTWFRIHYNLYYPLGHEQILVHIRLVKEDRLATYVTMIFQVSVLFHFVKTSFTLPEYKATDRLGFKQDHTCVYCVIIFISSLGKCESTKTGALRYTRAHKGLSQTQIFLRVNWLDIRC